MPREGIMLCYPYETKRLQRWKQNFVYVQPKYNGERCRIIFTPNGPKLYSSEANEILHLPHLNEQLRSYDLNHFEEFDAELYTHGMCREDIHSIVSRKVNQHERSEDIKLYLFDTIDSVSIQTNRLRRLYDLETSRTTLPNIVFSPTFKAVSEARIETILCQQLEDGYEGIIIRNPNALYKRSRNIDIMKWKPMESDYYIITSFTEEKDKFGNPKGRLGSIHCKGDDGTEFDAGSGLSDAERIYWWKEENKSRLILSVVHVQYQMKTRAKSLISPVILHIEDKTKEI